MWRGRYITMSRAATVLLLVGAVSLGVLRAQAPDAFDAASIKRNMSGETGARGQVLPGGRIVLTNNTVRGMLRNFLRLQDYQIAGGPPWVATERWDVIAKADPTASFERIGSMVRTLLEDRFKLVSHVETRVLPVYSLQLARADRRPGPGLRVSATDCAAYEALVRRSGEPPVPPGGMPVCGSNSSEGRIRAGARTMSDFARTLSVMTGRAVVDETGLTGAFDVELTWTPEAPAGSAAAAAGQVSEGGSLFTAIREQLGLKLEAARGPVDVFVIDSVERPVED